MVAESKLVLGEIEIPSRFQFELFVKIFFSLNKLKNKNCTYVQVQFEGFFIDWTFARGVVTDIPINFK